MYYLYFIKHHIPTTPNTFLISGTTMASRSTPPRMIRVAKMWISQEKGRPPNSSKMAAFRAWTHKQSLIQPNRLTEDVLC